MARSYVDAHREPLALVFLHHGIVRRFYAPERFPYLEVGIGLPAPEHSIAGGISLGPLEASAIVECDPATWLGERARRKVVTLSEQVLAQREGHAMVLLHAEMRA